MFGESAGLGADAAAGKRSVDVLAYDTFEVGPELKKFAADGGDVPMPIQPTDLGPASPPQTKTFPVDLPGVAETEQKVAEIRSGTSNCSNFQNGTDRMLLQIEDPHKVNVVKGPLKDQATSAREIRLEQNRKAARESRRRKKVMIEELQRSVIFFSRANSTLKQQNEDLARVLMTAQSKIKAINEGKDIESLVFAEPKSSQPNPVQDASTTAAESSTSTLEPVVAESPARTTPAPAAPTQQEQQAQAQAVATQAMLESQGYPAAAARMAAQTMNAGSMSVPAMQPGATMQAMANFQTACAQAMQAAIQGMQSVPGLNLAQMQAAVPGTNIQQAFTDQMTAYAMQQAAAAHMGAQQFMLAAPLLAGNAMWAANSAAAVAAAAQPQAPPSTKETTEGNGDNEVKNS